MESFKSQKVLSLRYWDAAITIRHIVVSGHE